MSPIWKKNKILIIIFGILVIFSLNFFKKGIKNFFYLISTPIQKIFWQIGDNLSDFSQTIWQVREMKNKQEALRLKYQQLLSQNIQLKELKRENELLRKILDFGLEKEFKLKMARMISKDISQDSILIDKGAKDGISKGSPVITPQKILVGRVSEIYENFSKVILLSNKESSFEAKIQGSQVMGIIKGSGHYEISLERIPNDKEIKEKDIIITISLSRVFPSNLLIGEIKSVKKSDLEPFQQAEVLPFFVQNESEILLIISEF